MEHCTEPRRNIFLPRYIEAQKYVEQSDTCIIHCASLVYGVYSLQHFYRCLVLRLLVLEIGWEHNPPPPRVRNRQDFAEMSVIWSLHRCFFGVRMVLFGPESVKEHIAIGPCGVPCGVLAELCEGYDTFPVLTNRSEVFCKHGSETSLSGSHILPMQSPFASAYNHRVYWAWHDL